MARRIDEPDANPVGVYGLGGCFADGFTGEMERPRKSLMGIAPKHHTSRVNDRKRVADVFGHSHKMSVHVIHHYGTKMS